jgi:hypothetical protein
VPRRRGYLTDLLRLKSVPTRVRRG